MAKRAAFWNHVERLDRIFAILLLHPIQLGISFVIGVMGQRVPYISALGWFGMAAIFLAAYLILSVCAFFQSRAKRKARGVQPENDGWLYRFVHSQWWGWLFFAACMVIGCLFIETRPRLPLGVDPVFANNPIASYREMSRNTIVGRTVILSEIPREKPDYMTIRNKKFLQCNIIGFAVVCPMGCTFSTSTVYVHPVVGKEGALLETDGQATMGMIGLENCTFSLCTFAYISFAGNRQFIEEMRSKVPYRECFGRDIIGATSNYSPIHAFLPRQ